MARKPNQTEKKKIKAFEKDVKEEKKLWGRIERIHLEDENLLSLFRNMFRKNSTNKSPKMAMKKPTKKKR